MSLIIAVFVAVASLNAGCLLWLNLYDASLFWSIIGVACSIVLWFISFISLMLAVSIAQHNRLSK